MEGIKEKYVVPLGKWVKNNQMGLLAGVLGTAMFGPLAGVTAGLLPALAGVDGEGALKKAAGFVGDFMKRNKLGLASGAIGAMTLGMGPLGLPLGAMMGFLPKMLGLEGMGVEDTGEALKGMMKRNQLGIGAGALGMAALGPLGSSLGLSPQDDGR